MLYVTQLAAETLSIPATRNLRVSLAVLEAIGQPATRNLCVSQSAVEVLRRTSVDGSGSQPIVIVVAG